MIAVDTNILLPAVEQRHPNGAHARAFLNAHRDSDDIAISEFVLVELYGLLRNPSVVARPLSAVEAARVCGAFRRHPRWLLLGFPPDSVALHDALWSRVRERPFARRRIYDLRLGLSLLLHGVTDLATVNVKDFEGLGFHRVWNPLDTT
jgi:predicted nucleic acid-binding protein